MDYGLVCEIKELNDDGTFHGIASVIGEEDLGGDVIDKGAFKRTVAANPTVPILWQHMSAEVIGIGEVKEWQNKLVIDGRLDMDDPMAQKAHRKMKNKLVKGLSIGFQTIKSTWEDIEGRMVRHIQELKLWEVSVVTFPMQPSAQVTRVKNAEDSEARLSRLEKDFQALQAKLGTPAVAPPDSPPATDPPPVQDPVVDHSALGSVVAAMLSDVRSRH